MKQRGRKSAAELEVVTPVRSIKRPPAPSDLTDEVAEEWRAIVGRLPPDWFPRETHGVLAQYCRHVIASRRVGKLIANLEKEPRVDLDEYDQLLRMHEREGRALSALATRLRITQQSSIHKSRQKPVDPETPKPWERSVP